MTLKRGKYRHAMMKFYVCVKRTVKYLKLFGYSIFVHFCHAISTCTLLLLLGFVMFAFGVCAIIHTED